MIHWTWLLLAAAFGAIGFPAFLFWLTLHYERKQPDDIEDDPPLGI